MSSNLAFAAPLHSPREKGSPREHDSTPHIEIVSSRAQRKARPRIVYALVAVAGLFALFLAQLLLSIVVSDGAYRIAGLQGEQRDLGRQQQALSEKLDLLSSPQNLAAQAESLGMVLSTTSPVFLRLADGAIVGTASPAGEGQTVIAATGSLVPNALLGDVPLVAQNPADAIAPLTPGGFVEPTPGAPAAAVPPGSVASNPMALPSPVSR